MKNEIRLALLCLAAAFVPALAQNTTDSRCGSANYDSSRNMFTIINPIPGTANQQCFITVVPKQSWTGGVPDLASSQLVEGNYEVVLSGGGGAGGDAERGRTEGGGGGGIGGGSAVPVTMVRYLNPGVYRLTIGSGGQSGASSGGRGGDGAPTSLSNAYSGETVAGFPGAESWNGNYPLTAIAYSGTPAKSGERGVDGGTSTGSKGVGDRGTQGGNGFIQLALKDSVPQAAPVQAAPAASSGTETTPAPAAARPARKDRN